MKVRVRNTNRQVTDKYLHQESLSQESIRGRALEILEEWFGI